MFNITSEPQAGINGRSYGVPAARVVGGGTVVNGMAFDRGSAGDYDLWEDIGNSGWGWDGLLPYFKKVSFPTDIRNVGQKLTAVNRAKPILIPRRRSHRIMESSMIPQRTDLKAPSRLPCQHISTLQFVSACFYVWRCLNAFLMLMYKFTCRIVFQGLGTARDCYP